MSRPLVLPWAVLVPEQWRPVAEDPRYEISDRGSVRGPRGLLHHFLSGAGYPTVHLGRRRKALVHRLVAATFVSPRDGACEVNHIDGDKQNNAETNLEWVTHSENHRHAVRTGLRASGERSALAKLDAATVRAIRAAHAAGGRGYDRLARDFGISRTAVAHIVRRETWRQLA